MISDQTWERYVERLLPEARRFLRGQTRPQVDPEDVVQSVLNSLFNHLAAPGHPDDLWTYLLASVRRHSEKWNQRARRHPALALPAEDAGAKGPSPEEEAAFADLLEHLLSGVTEPTEREILSLHLAGWSVPEIGRRVGRIERTVRRTLDRMKTRLRERVGTDEPASSPA